MAADAKTPLPRLLQLDTPQATVGLAEYLAPLLQAGDIICLDGELGSGKTFFAAALGRALGVPEDLDSPSFVLLKEYQAARFPLYHLDLYRLHSPSELLDLGLFDFLESGVTLIEWPRLALSLIPGRLLQLDLKFSFDGRRRQVEILARGRWAAYFV